MARGSGGWLNGAQSQPSMRGVSGISPLCPALEKPVQIRVPRTAQRGFQGLERTELGSDQPSFAGSYDGESLPVRGPSGDGDEQAHGRCGALCDGEAEIGCIRRVEFTL